MLAFKRFAENQADIAQHLFMIRKLKKEYIKNGLAINFNKTEYTSIPGEDVQSLEIADGQEIKEADKFKYLGFVGTKHGRKDKKTDYSEQTCSLRNSIRYIGLHTLQDTPKQ